MARRGRVKPKARAAAARRSKLGIVGAVVLLEGEDRATYDELVIQVWAAVKPVNAIEATFAADIVRLEWDILRYRRLKLNLISKFADPEIAKDMPLLKEWCEKLSFYLLGTHAPEGRMRLSQPITVPSDAGLTTSSSSKCLTTSRRSSGSIV